LECRKLERGQLECDFLGRLKFRAWQVMPEQQIITRMLASLVRTICKMVNIGWSR
jgi:hypothetical protein